MTLSSARARHHMAALSAAATVLLTACCACKLRASYYLSLSHVRLWCPPHSINTVGRSPTTHVCLHDLHTATGIPCGGCCWCAGVRNALRSTMQQRCLCWVAATAVPGGLAMRSSKFCLGDCGPCSSLSMPAVMAGLACLWWSAPVV